MAKNSKSTANSAELSIKKAAHKVFLAKGFSAATVRDVAKEAGTNVALVNYYYRSKRNLFTVVMSEKFQLFLGTIFPILNNEDTTLDQKIDAIVSSYIEFLTKNADLPTFILNELRKGKFEFMSRARYDKVVRQSSFMNQLKEESRDINPVHVFLSLMSMIVFPFVARPMLLQTGLVNEQIFQKMMMERKTLIPAWIKAIRSMNHNLHPV